MQQAGHGSLFDCMAIDKADLCVHPPHHLTHPWPCSAHPLSPHISVGALCSHTCAVQTIHSSQQCQLMDICPSMLCAELKSFGCSRAAGIPSHHSLPPSMIMSPSSMNSRRPSMVASTGFPAWTSMMTRLHEGQVLEAPEFNHSLRPLVVVISDLPGLGQRVHEILEVLISVQLIVKLCTQAQRQHQNTCFSMEDQSSSWKTLLSFFARVTAASVLEYVLLYTEILKPLSAILRARFCVKRLVSMHLLQRQRLTGHSRLACPITAKPHKPMLAILVDCEVLRKDKLCQNRANR